MAYLLKDGVALVFPDTGSVPDRAGVWRGTGVACLVAGFAWTAFDLLDRVSSEDRMSCRSAYGWTQVSVDTIAFLAMVPVLVGLFVAYRKSGKGWLGVTAIVAAAGFAMSGMVNFLEHCFVETITFPFQLFPGIAESSPYVLGILLSLAVIPFTIALTRVSFLPTWIAWLLVAASIFFVVMNNQGGAIVFGISWIVIGIYLLTHRTESPTNSDDVRNLSAMESG